MDGKERLEKQVLANHHYRKVLMTGNSLQVVLMCLEAGETVPWEMHEDTDQFVRVEDGALVVDMHGKQSVILKAGDAIIIPSGTKHRLSNANVRKPVRLYTIYQNIEHPVGLVERRQ